METISLPIKLSLLSVVTAVLGLVLFIFDRPSLRVLSPWAVWLMGLMFGTASPLFAYSAGVPQHGQYYFGFACNLSFLLVLFFLIPTELT